MAVEVTDEALLQPCHALFALFGRITQAHATLVRVNRKRLTVMQFNPQTALVGTMFCG